ncbi:dihydrolipoamide acetyltransferase family protein [Piscinibacter sakaiensis]|uniref:dihydrolipoamide acetyltransferase family protein n=1 Tax=Piscinibacter sakaiensis TaxID=1547922 RepID=UPI003AAB6320
MSRSHVIKMPDLGEGIAEVELVAWHVKVGDSVAEDQVLADVMTDKATVEIPSPVAGTVEALGGEVGEVLAVGAEMIRIDTGEGAASEDADATAAAPAPEPEPQTEVEAEAQPEAAPEPAPPPPAAAPAPAPAPAAGGSQRIFASPAVRARAWELGIDLHDVTPTGTAGRIMQADLDAHLQSGGRRSASAGPGTAQARPTSAKAGSTEEIKIIGLRRRIAQKMQDSKRRIPHYAYVEEVDVTELEALRTRLNQRWGDRRGRLTLLPMLIRAIVIAVQDFPMVNAWFDDEAGVVTQHGSVHVGVAAQTDAGLMVPVLRDAQDGDFWSHASEIARLADAARSGKATRDELTGSTITLTSLGKLGGIVTTPVINTPEVAIVGVNKMVPRPMVRDGAIAIRQMMNLSSSFDHRVVDGADAAAFIQRVREMLEQPALLFIE